MEVYTAQEEKLQAIAIGHARNSSRVRPPRSLQHLSTRPGEPTRRKISKKLLMSHSLTPAATHSNPTIRHTHKTTNQTPPETLGRALDRQDSPRRRQSSPPARPPARRPRARRAMPAARLRTVAFGCRDGVAGAPDPPGYAAASYAEVRRSQCLCPLRATFR